jgi:hypothetical protein
MFTGGKRATLIVAWGLMLVAALPATADVVNVSGLNTPVNGHLNLDVNGDGVNDVTLQNQSSLAGINFLGTQFFNRNVGANGSVSATPVVAGSLIGPNTLFSATRCSAATCSCRSRL